ncbi:hypothetical protein VOLCADRAFT_92100 [Volvox carteri f. nagariensis]|uniref:AB hydrolase-1 domain-containing protein n=1 Tax=Volvox carteri f. nagariensis TaxID=3068 RepID=D8TYL2_VOLCA|nr:uncharacterized protein VOLCADRAFT_92100 [Volvox carteri f. nagariensis]EFJ47329.1 hypothetical protein VOLCADRAFT_92100 [Volvox carteri f. nagariensis]|eukprot:XP_002951518.1 hypothetical protein VOLCADRAFT_92100 [Volvox carteri f. nagariensis]
MTLAVLLRRHLATHRGYAIAPDGIRLFFEIFECHGHTATGYAAPESACCYEVRATGALFEGSVNMSPDKEAARDGQDRAEISPKRANKHSLNGVSVTPGSAVATPTAAALAVSSGSEAAALTAVAVIAGPQEEGNVVGMGSAGNSAGADVGSDGGSDGGQHRQSGLPGSSSEPGKAVVMTAAEPVGTAPSGLGGPWKAELEASQVGKAAASAAFASTSSSSTVSAFAASTTGCKEDVANVLLIMGFAAGRNGWLPLIQHWMKQADSEPLLRHQRVRFCVFDNRGIGDSDSPPHSKQYSTTVMASDALAVMDRLGWHKAHVVGFSMGGMIALRLAVQAPERLLSLTALSVTNGGWQVIPTRWRAVKLLMRAATARTPRERAHADVHFHFSRATLHAQIPVLDSCDGGDSGGGNRTVATAQVHQSVETALIDEYVSTSQEGAPQPHSGVMGQLHAVWNHGLSVSEQRRLRHLAVPFKVIHGDHDMMAMPSYGERIAKHTGAEFIMLSGGHFVARECAPEVCIHIAESIVSARKLKRAT